MNLYLLTYDIPDSKMRIKISEVCLDYGLRRIQHSVFLGELKKRWLRNLIQEIEDIKKKDKRCDIRVFKVLSEDHSCTTKKPQSNLN